MQLNVVVTGANRGLGLEFCRQYLKSGARVFATCRTPNRADHLNKLKKDYADQLIIHMLDICSQDAIKQFVAEIKDVAVDIVINNAGVMGPRGQFDFPPAQVENPEKEWLSVLNTNTIAPVIFSMALLPNLKEGQEKKIVMISSTLGSIEQNTSGGMYMYRSSKAGLNAAAKSLHINCLPLGISVVLLHPGWVRTDMGGKDADIDAVTSVKGMRQVIEKASLNKPFRLTTYNGEILPW